MIYYIILIIITIVYSILLYSSNKVDKPKVNHRNPNMSRYSQTNISTIAGVNSELSKISTAIDSLLDREGTTPNSMESDLDLNSNSLLNVANGVAGTDGVNLNQLNANATATNTNSILTNVTVSVEGQTVFTTPKYVLGANLLSVYVNGQYQYLSTAYYESSDTTVTFREGLNLDDVVYVVANQVPSLEGTIGANLVEYTYNTGAGAVAQTVQAKLDSMIVSVKDFGAVGNGVVDDTLAIQTAITHAQTVNGRVFFPVGTYSINDSLDLQDGVYLEGETTKGTIIKFDYTVTGKPILDVSGLSVGVKNMTLRYSTLPPDTDADAVCLQFTDTDSATAWSEFSDLYMYNCYGGIGDNTSTSIPFNNIFTNISIRNWTGWALALEDTSNSGNLFDGFYANNNWDRGSGAESNTCLGLLKYKNGGQGTFNMLNLEHAIPSDQRPIQFGADCRVTINSLHLEDIDYRHTNPSAFLFSGTRSQTLINTMTFNSLTVDSTYATGNFYLFEVTGGGNRVSIKGATIFSDCAIDSGGTDYWLRLSGMNDAENASVDISDALDQTDSTDLSGTPFMDEEVSLSSQALWPVFKRFNDKYYNFQYKGYVADDTAVSFTPTSPQGLMYIHVEDNLNNSGLFMYRVEAGGTVIDMISAAADLEDTTGVLTGTTGTDVKATVSVHTDGKIYIENRTGAAKTITLKEISSQRE